MIQLRPLLAITLLLAAAATASSQKLVGSGLLRFGWKPDRCAVAVGDMSRYTATTGLPDNDVEKFSYAPASWEGIPFDCSVLDFYKDKLYQIAFCSTTTIADKSTFTAVVKRLTEVYGKPRPISQDSSDHLLWRAKGGNLAIAEYTYNEGMFYTYLMLIDNSTSIKKSRDKQNR